MLLLLFTMQLFRSIKIVSYEGNSVSEKNATSNLHINAGIPVHKLPMCTFNILTTPNRQFVFYVRQFSKV